MAERVGRSPNPTQEADRPPGEARPIGGVREANCREIESLAERVGESLSDLFDEMAQWEAQLRALERENPTKPDNDLGGLEP
jgi:hypothetical protein